MSIWATFWSAIKGDEEGAPIAYQGSHVLPDDEDQRGGYVGLALVPSHVTRDGRDDHPQDGTPYPWVRVSVGQENAVLDEQQAAAMYRALGDWLLARKGSGSAEAGVPSR